MLVLVGVGVAVAGVVRSGDTTEPVEVITEPTPPSAPLPPRVTIDIAGSETLDDPEVVVPDQALVLGDDHLALTWTTSCNAPGHHVEVDYSGDAVTIQLWIGGFLVIDCVGEPSGPWSTVVPFDADRVDGRPVHVLDPQGSPAPTIVVEVNDVEVVDAAGDEDPPATVPASVGPATRRGVRDGQQVIALQWYAPNDTCWRLGSVRWFVRQDVVVPAVGLSRSRRACGPSVARTIRTGSILTTSVPAPGGLLGATPVLGESTASYLGPPPPLFGSIGGTMRDGRPWTVRHDEREGLCVTLGTTDLGCDTSGPVLSPDADPATPRLAAEPPGPGRAGRLRLPAGGRAHRGAPLRGRHAVGARGRRSVRPLLRRGGSERR